MLFLMVVNNAKLQQVVKGASAPNAHCGLPEAILYLQCTRKYERFYPTRLSSTYTAVSRRSLAHAAKFLLDVQIYLTKQVS